MKKLLNIALLVFVLVLTVALIASCGNESKKEKVVTDGDYLDDLSADLDFNGEKVNIFHWGSSFVTNELTADGATGDVVDLAVAKRNLSAEERLNVTLNFIKGEIPAEVYMPVVRDEIMSGSTDYDIIYGVQCTGVEVAAAGAFLNLEDNKYIDFTKPYWNDDYNEALSVNTKRYMVGGDISLTTTAWASTMTFKLQKFENIFGSTQDFYNMVLEGDGGKGGWTIDTMSEYCRDAYQDLNGNGLADNADLYGLSFEGTSSVSDQFTFSAGVKYSSRDENNVPVLDMKSNQVINWFEKFYRMCWENQGVHMTSADYADLNADIACIFGAGLMDGLVEARDEEEDFGVIPYPKADENMDKYSSWISDCTCTVSIPVTESEDRIDMASAVVECMASETSRLCLPAYYETALKDKYARDEMSLKMLDIIHDGETTDFVSVYSASLGDVGGFMRALIGWHEDDIVSWLDAKSSMVDQKLKELFAAYEQNTQGSFVPETTVTLASEEAADLDIADNQISTNWEVFGAKYRKSQILINDDMSDKFAYLINDNDEIEVRSPSIEVAGGYYPCAIIESRATLPLAGLTCEFHSDEGFTYDKPDGGYSASLSIGWTDIPITGNQYYLDGPGTNGLRGSFASGAQGVCLSFMGSADTGGTIADYFYIITFDGTDPVLEIDNRVGARFTNKVQTDVSQPVTIEFKEDETLGYVVVMNGDEYRTGTRGTETYDIDLNCLKNVPEGHFCMLGESTGSDGYSNFTLSKINGKPAGSFFD